MGCEDCKFLGWTDDSEMGDPLCELYSRPLTFALQTFPEWCKLPQEIKEVVNGSETN